MSQPTEPRPGRIPCTVQILTLNCADILERCLKSVADFDDILVCDGNSTDGTLDIARKYGARIIKQADTDEPNYRLKDFAAARNKCIDQGKYDWNFYLDSDEELPARTAEEIREITSRSTIEHYVYKIPNKILYEGKEIRYAVPYPGYQMRLLNRLCGARHERTPHSRLIFDEQKYPVGYMKNPWYVIIEHNRWYSPNLNYGHIRLEIEGTMKLPLREFLYWIVWKKIVRMVRVTVKTVLLYMRHGFKETLPPRIEFLRVEYQWLLFWGAIGMRLRRGFQGDGAIAK